MFPSLLYDNNLEHGLATLTESFSPLESELHNLPCWSPKQKCALSYAIPFYTMYTTTRLNRFFPASASSNQPVWLAWSANCIAGNFHWDADVIFNRYFNCQVICIGKTRWLRTMCCLQNESVTYSPLLTKHRPWCSKMNNYTIHTYYTITLCR